MTVQYDDLGHERARELMSERIATLKLTCEFVFVPWSMSRNKDEKHPSLNYRVTLKRNGHNVLTCDYSMGAAYAPSYKGNKGEGTVVRDARVKAECETGKPHFWADGYRDGARPRNGGKLIVPQVVDVLSSLCLDADVLNYSRFEEWAREFGYEEDSRKAESIYRACLEHALALKNAIGFEALGELQGLANQL